MKDENGYTIGIANDILAEHGIYTAYRGNAKCLIRGSVEVQRPENPKDCYELLKKHFYIDEPRLKDFK